MFSSSQSAYLPRYRYVLDDEGELTYVYVYLGISMCMLPRFKYDEGKGLFSYKEVWQYLAKFYYRVQK